MLGSEGYPLNVRVWESPGARTTLLLLHGVVSHSGWLTNIAKRLSGRGISVVCPDRRGSGANTLNRGDAPDETRLLEDVFALAEHYRDPRVCLHLGGFCWGAVYAINVLSREPGIADSLALLAPAVFPVASMREAVLNCGSSSVPSEQPIVPLDAFTRTAAYEDFILPDKLKLEGVSPRFNGVMQSLSRLVGVRLVKLNVPTLMVLAGNDQVTDNAATERAFQHMRARPKRLAWVPGDHGVQFDAPDETAQMLHDWLAALANEQAPSS